jgi:hypothetical protein
MEFSLGYLQNQFGSFLEFGGLKTDIIRVSLPPNPIYRAWFQVVLRGGCLRVKLIKLMG